MRRRHKLCGSIYLVLALVLWNLQIPLVSLFERLSLPVGTKKEYSHVLPHRSSFPRLCSPLPVKSKESSLLSEALPPVHINSSWMGNQWIPPPGYKTYSARKIQDFFRHESILIVGDSTARRMYGTLYGILNATTDTDNVQEQQINGDNVIDVNKNNETEPCKKEGFALCREMPSYQDDDNDDGGNNTKKNNLFTKHNYDQIRQVCLSDLVNMTEDANSLFRRSLQNYSLVVFIMGPWEVGDMSECGSGLYGRKNQTDDIFRALFDASSNDQTRSRTEFVWRTWGSTASLVDWNKAKSHNDYTKLLIDNREMERHHRGLPMGNVSYIDWGQAMRPRLFPEEQRISGDMLVHYGLEARLAFVQMLLNHLKERRRQRQFNIEPWRANNNHKNGSNSDAGAGFGGGTAKRFMTLTPHSNLSAEEKAMFCGECLWSRTITCETRKTYLRFRYKSPEKSVVSILLSTPACNRAHKFPAR